MHGLTAPTLQQHGRPTSVTSTGTRASSSRSYYAGGNGGGVQMASVNAEQQPQQQQQQQQQVPASLPATNTVNHFEKLMTSLQASGSTHMESRVPVAVPSAPLRQTIPTSTTSPTPTTINTPHSTNVSMSMSMGIPSSSMPLKATAGGASGSQSTIYPHPTHLQRVTPSQHHVMQGSGLAQGQGQGQAQGQGLVQSRQGSALDDIHATRYVDY